MTTPAAFWARSLSAAARSRLRAWRTTSWPSPMRAPAAARPSPSAEPVKWQGLPVSTGGVGAEDGPADLGPPVRLVGCVPGAAQVVLAQRPVDADLVRGGVRAEPGVAEVRVGE